MEFSPKQQTTELIKKAERILLVGSIHPDPDTLGSMLAFSAVLSDLGKDVTAVVSAKVSENYNFLPAIDILQAELKGSKDVVVKVPLKDNPVEKLSYDVKDGYLNIVLSAKNTPYKQHDFVIQEGAYKYDLIVVLDTPDIDKIDRIYDKNAELFFEKPVINIDHHAGNEYFGTVNLVDITDRKSVV